jgi:hypothetical protein
VTTHLYMEENIPPVAFSKNVRGVLDGSGPHFICCGLRCVSPAGVSPTANLSFTYELPNGELQTVQTPWIVLTDTSQAGGGIWYTKVEMAIDQYHPLGDGLLADPYGVFTLDLQVSGGSIATALITYEATVEVLDGNPSVVRHP